MIRHAGSRSKRQGQNVVAQRLAFGLSWIVLAWVMALSAICPCQAANAPTVYEAGQLVRLECSTNPFNPSQTAVVKVYDSPSSFGKVVLQGCGTNLRVQGVSGYWVQVQDMAGKVTGYVSAANLVLVQEAPRRPAASPPAGPGAPDGAGPAPAAIPDTQPGARPSAVDAGSAPQSDSGSKAPLAQQAPPAQAPAPAIQWGGATKQTPAESPSASTGANKPEQGQKPAVEWGTLGPQDPRIAPLQEPSFPTRPSPPPLNSEKTKQSRKRVESDEGPALQPHRCSALYMKMSTGNVLTKEEADYLRRHCN